MIRKNINRKNILLFCLLLSFQFQFATVHLIAPTRQIVSPFNKYVVADSVGNYSFIVSGHFHGESSNKSTFPAATLLAGIDTLNGLNPSFLMSLGDMFIDVNETYISNYNKSLFSKLKMPLFNAVGNHDIANGNYYEKVFGKSYYSFVVNSELFVVLNTELNDGSIVDEQLIFLKSILNDASLEKIKNVFIFSHRPIWSENNATYVGLFQGNTRTALGENNFEDEIRPLLKKVSTNKSVYWISGSMADAPASFFYHQEADTKITFMQTAIRDLPRDAVLKVNVKDGEISLAGISLTGETLLPVESYDLMNYWSRNSINEEPFSFRLLPYLIIKTISHNYFWIGFVSSLLILLILRFLVNRWKRRR